jgi:hypothetical protein
MEVSMCIERETGKTKVDLLIEAMDRLAFSFLESRIAIPPASTGGRQSTESGVVLSRNSAQDSGLSKA